jgi:rare lipoprotein A (peptidoglycan hydrolase)
LTKANSVKRRGAIAAILVVSLLRATAASAAPSPNPESEQRSRIRSAEERITELQKRLSSLLSELRSLEGQMNTTYSQLGATHLRIDDLENRAVRLRTAFNARARQAYKDRGWSRLRVLLQVQTLSQFMSRWRILGDTFRRDASAYKDLLAARDQLDQELNGVDVQKQGLLQTNSRLQDLKAEITHALKSEQTVLQKARDELGRLESLRRARERGVSPAVAARRAARQIVLDQRLEQLLAWYAPGAGAEPFMPAKLRGTEIQTTGLTSWYGPGFDRRRASSGATYKQEQLTAASLILPFGTLLKVSFRGKAVVVVITDRGPYVEGRVLDLSKGAADALGLRGVKEVTMEIVTPKTPAPPFP